MITSTLMPDTFINLPTEILLTIFESQTSFHDIRSLFSTCKTVHSLWKTRIHSISSHLLKTQIPCYSDLNTVLQAFETISSPTDPTQEQRYPCAIERIQLCYQFTKQADYVCEMVQTRYLQQKHACRSAVCRGRAHTAELLPQERVSIISAHHFVKLFALGFQYPAVHWDRVGKKLEGMSVGEKHTVQRVKLVMYDYALPWDRLRLGICAFGNPMVGAGEVWVDDWDGMFRCLEKETRVLVDGCGECVWDDDGVFSRMAGHGGHSRDG